jgi:sec-independent protein translocase protein TatB
MAHEFRRSFDEMSRQAELDELRTELNALRQERPLGSVAQALHEPILPADMMAPISPSPESEIPTPDPAPPAS